MPNVFELADRIQIMRLGRRVAVVTPTTHTMPEAVAIMTGATLGDEQTARADTPPSGDGGVSST
jgi:fructose transport system ATP-binding protein